MPRDLTETITIYATPGVQCGLTHLAGKCPCGQQVTVPQAMQTREVCAIAPPHSAWKWSHPSSNPRPQDLHR